jgi:hypothetical protein
MRDSVFHDRRMMGGMWGGVGGTLSDITARIDAWGQYERWGDSDRFLSEIVWPLIAECSVCHDSSDHFGDARPFPVHPPLEGTCYVGEIVPVDRRPLDVWREVGVLRDQVTTLHREIAQRDAQLDVLRTELAPTRSKPCDHRVTSVPRRILRRLRGVTSMMRPKRRTK